MPRRALRCGEPGASAGVVSCALYILAAWGTACWSASGWRMVSVEVLCQVTRTVAGAHHGGCLAHCSVLPYARMPVVHIKGEG